MNIPEDIIQILSHCGSLESAKQVQQSLSDPNRFISIHNQQGKYLSTSASFEELTGRKSEEVLDTSAYDYFHGDDLTDILKSHASITLTPEVSVVSYRFRKKDDTYVRLISYSKNVSEESGAEFIVALSELVD